MATLKTRFDLGQRVYHLVGPIFDTITKPCDTCGANGKVSLPNMEPIRCPKCCGSMHIRVEIRPRKEVETFIVKNIQYQTRIDRELKDRIVYMDNNTGTGRIWAENELFDSKDKANTACKIFNDNAKSQYFKQDKGYNREIRP